MVAIVANLACEAEWAGWPLPGQVRARLGNYATLLRGLVFAERVELMAPASADPARICAVPGLPTVCVATQANPRLPQVKWAGPAGVPGYDPGDVPWGRAVRVTPPSMAVTKHVNDRRFGLAVMQHHGLALPGARVLTSVEAFGALVAAGGAALGDGHWVCKAPWTAAGRDRVFGHGDSMRARAEVGSLLARHGGTVVFEPWVARLHDVGLCATVDEGSQGARIELAAPHGLVCSPTGGFAGVQRLPEVGLLSEERTTMERTAHVIGGALFEAGYRGPYAMDGFVYRRPDGARAFLPMCEVNARLTFGWVALALCHRLGGTALRFGRMPSAPHVPLLAPAPRDPRGVWLDG